MQIAKVEKRTALLIRCSEEESELIRTAAQSEHCTISGFILNVVAHRLAARDKTQDHFEETFGNAFRSGKGRAGIPEGCASESLNAVEF